MSKVEKLIKRFKGKPKDFHFDELRRLLRHYGFEEVKRGKTAGSRVAFSQNDFKHIISLHKPHDGILKRYQLDQIENMLKHWGLKL